MKKQGFTMIELLAVIAILEILIIFVVPAVINLLDNARKNAFLVEAKNVYKAVEY